MENWTPNETKWNSSNELGEMENKRRHGCITAWFIFGVVTNLLAGLGYILLRDSLPALMKEVGQVSVDLTPNYFIVEGVVSLIVVVCYIQLWQWKKIGFHGLILCTMITASVNYMADPVWTQLIFSFVGILIQYMILQIKENGRTAWSWLN